MTEPECRAIEQKCVEDVRKALKTITSGEIYDGRGYLNEKGYKALEEIEGLDLFWIGDPLITLAKESEAGKEVKAINLPQKYKPVNFPKDGFIHTYAERSEEKLKPVGIDEYFNAEESEAEDE